MNAVVLIGRCVRDPELRYAASGTAVGNVSLAVDRDYRDKDGKRETDFIEVVLWKKDAENTAQYCRKGSLVAVHGRIQVRSYEATDGRKRKAFEVVADRVQFLDPRGGRAERPPEADAGEEEDVPF